MRKYALTALILLACLLAFCQEASAATATTVSSLMNVLAEQKQQAVYNIKLNAPFNKGNSGIRESVNPETGEIIVANQVVALPGRNGQDLTLNLEYRSRDAKLFEEATKSAAISNGYGQTVIAFYDVFDANGYWLRTGGLKYTTSETTIIAQTTLNSETWIFNGYLQYENGTSLLTSASIANATREKSRADQAKYAFGVGWSLDIPSLTVDGDNVYVHLPSGKTYQADFSAGVGLKDYELTNIVFTRDTTYSNGIDASAYKLYYAGGQAYYFTAQGELLSQKDRFNNTIIYYWTASSGQRLLTRIADTVGRVVDIEYNDTQISFKTQGRTVRLLRTLIPGQTGKYYLTAYIDPAGRKTTYSYSLDTALFDAIGKTAASNQYANLADILYPTGARTRYLFTKGTKNLGSSGYMEYYKVKERWDTAGGKDYNRLTYQYANEPDGYPQYKVSAIDELYKYTTSLVDSNGMVSAILYNGKHFPCVKTIKADRLLSETRTDYNPKNNLPAKVYTKTFNKGGKSVTHIDLYEYDHRGNLIMENHPENEKQIGSDDHKTRYTYDYAFNLSTGKAYQQDVDTMVKIEYQLSDDKKTIAAQNIYSNDDLISAKKYTYDDYGNIISQTIEKEPGQWVTTRFEYDAKYKGAYLTAVIAEDVKDADGNTQKIRTESQYDFHTGQITETRDGNGNLTQYRYDSLGRVTKEILPDQASRVYHYDDQNNLLQVTNANRNTLVYQYDPLGKLTSVSEPVQKVELVRLSYDSQEKLIRQADGNQNIQSYRYDEFARLSQVVGVLSQDEGRGETAIYIPVETAREIARWTGQSNGGDRSSGKDRYSTIKVKAAGRDQVEGVVAEVKKLGYQAWSPAESLKEMNKFFMIIQLILGGIGAISLLVASIGIMNTMFMSILERTREIGIMKVIGAGIPDIRRLFLLESGFIGFLGGISGLGIAYGVTAVINAIARAKNAAAMMGGEPMGNLAIIPVWLALFALGFAVVVGVIAGLLPAYRAARISPLQAIRQE